MNHFFFKALFIHAVLLILACNSSTERSNKTIEEPPKAEGYHLQPVPFDQVVLKDKFWKPRLKTQMETLVPFALDKTIPAQQALQKAGAFLDGEEVELPRPHRYQSSDLYKVMEGAAYLLHDQKNEALEQRMDSIIDIIASAQKEDGYLYVAHVTGAAKDHDAWGGGGMGDKPYSFVLHSHELYNMGHMYEGAIAYYQATGKDKWLKVAEKNAKHINKVFFEGDPNYNDGKPVNQAPGHQELELALIKLFRVTGNNLYLDMARRFLDIRGVTLVPEGEGVMSATYAQQHLPVKDQRKAVGHSVRATYLYSGMADVGALSGIDDYNEALKNIWHDLTDSKMSITGGLGAVHGIEGFGPSYVLPNKEAYNETCAAVGNVFFNFRMFLLTKDPKYMDVAEVALLNNALAGVNIEGNRFFYVNPLEADGTTPFNHGRAGRSPWFGTACCPTNIARLIPQVSGMMYSYTDEEIYATYYGSNETTIPLKGGNVHIKQESAYPFEGNIKFTMFPSEKGKQFKLKLRIPTWAHSNKFVPGDLYNYIDKTKGQSTISINGDTVSSEMDNGFLVIERKWEEGDEVVLTIPMPVRFNRTIDKVASNKGRIAITRGPLVYAAEGYDNGGVVQRFFLERIPREDQISESVISEGPLKDVVKVKLPADKIMDSGVKNSDLFLIPYYAWNNRDDGSMIVWLPNNEQIALIEDGKTARGGKYKEVRATSTHSSGNLLAISDPRRPSSSNDHTITPWISEGDDKQYLNIELNHSQAIRSIGVFFYREGARHDIKVKSPEYWKVQYKSDGLWKDMPMYVTDSYTVAMDEYNVVHPGENLKTDELRIEIMPSDNHVVGILDVDITFEEI